MQPHTASPGQIIPSEGTNDNFTALADGSGMTENNSLLLHRAETMPNFVQSGCIWAQLALLNGAMTAGTVFVTNSSGFMVRVELNAIASRAFTASKDTYIDVDSGGTLTYTEVANGAASPALASDRFRLGRVVTDGTNFTAFQRGYDSLGNVMGNMNAYGSDIVYYPTMLNSWVNYDTTHEQCHYLKDAAGTVFVCGMIRSGTNAANVFVLPVGFRPKLHLHFPAVSNGVFGYVRVDTNGSVLVNGNNTWYSLNGVSFKAQL